MSDLRIRSGPPAADPWPEPWFPRAAQAAGETLDDSAFAGLAARVADALGALFGLSFLVQPGRPLPAEAAEVAPELAMMLTAVRMGGAPGRSATGTGGVSAARHAGMIARLLSDIAERHWPMGCARADIWLECVHIADGQTLGGPVRLAAPPRDAAPPPEQPAGFAGHALALPMRLRIELSGTHMPLSALLPLRVGAVLPLAAHPEMPVLMGDHVVGRAAIVPLPDGRQQATILSIDPHPQGDRN